MQLIKCNILSSIGCLEILRESKYDTSTRGWILYHKAEGFISADDQRKALMLPNCDTFPFHPVCFVTFQEIYTCLESFVKIMLLRLYREELINSVPKSELLVKHSFGPLCAWSIYETPVYTCLGINTSCLIYHVKLDCALLVSGLLCSLSAVLSHRHLFT